MEKSSVEICVKFMTKEQQQDKLKYKLRYRKNECAKEKPKSVKYIKCKSKDTLQYNETKQEKIGALKKQLIYFRIYI